MSEGGAAPSQVWSCYSSQQMTWPSSTASESQEVTVRPGAVALPRRDAHPQKSMEGLEEMISEVLARNRCGSGQLTS